MAWYRCNSSGGGGLPFMNWFKEDKINILIYTQVPSYHGEIIYIDPSSIISNRDYTTIQLTGGGDTLGAMLIFKPDIIAGYNLSANNLNYSDNLNRCCFAINEDGTLVAVSCAIFSSSTMTISKDRLSGYDLAFIPLMSDDNFGLRLRSY